MEMNVSALQLPKPGGCNRKDTLRTQ